ncbi:hypothetical protein DFH28DRAFT_944023 [Melampsora americana]|nr:hypothetical protein DFH28DRAFT_944023 [Melampsora americana]
MSVILLKNKKEKTREHAHQTQQSSFQFNLTQPTSTFSISIHSISNRNSLQPALRFTPIFLPDQESPLTSDQSTSFASLLTFMGLPNHHSSQQSIYALPIRTKPFKLLSSTRKSSCKNSSDKSKSPSNLQSLQKRTILINVCFTFPRTSIPPIRITESPNGTSGFGIGGNHIWDCSLIMAWLIIIEPRLMIGEIELKSETYENTRTRILDERKGLRARVILTDLEELMCTKTKETLSKDTSIEIETIAYVWGSSVPFPTVDSKRSLILANDVLYNPENQPIFLKTILQLFKARTKICEEVSTLLAYRPRTENDHLFFQMVQQAGLVLERIARVGTVIVFKISPSLS